MRSWFGLIEQVAFAFSKTSLMEPFRGLLSKKGTFAWSEEMEVAFTRARDQIMRLMEKGVTVFVAGQWLCLVTDWSKTGIGYVLWQRKCKCARIHPMCCQGGWVVVPVCSRFCTAAETRYAPTEGELLWVAWTLSKTWHYTLGCPSY